MTKSRGRTRPQNMGCLQSLENGTKLRTHQVYIYEVPETATDRFLVFSFALHYWFATNEQGAAIVQMLRGVTIGSLRTCLAAKYGVGGPAFEREVLPFIEELMGLGFASTCESSDVNAIVTPSVNLDDPANYPFNVMLISLGDQCNLNCLYCFNKEQRSARLSLNSSGPDSDVLKRVMREFRELGGLEVVFTGGEPTLNPDLLDLCRTGKSIGLKTGFITNGTRLKHMCAESIVEAVDHIAVSLDTVKTAEMVKLWGTGEFNAKIDILAPIQHILSIADSRASSLRVSIKPTVTSINMAGMSSLVEIGARTFPSERLSWDITRFEPIGVENVDKSLDLSADAFDEVMIGCASVWQTAHDVTPKTSCSPSDIDNEAQRMGLSDFGLRLPQPHRRLLPCAPSFFITPFGDVYPCQPLEVKEFMLGNVHTSTLREMFARKSWADLKKRMTVDSLEVCRDCELRYACAKHCHGKSLQDKGCTTAFVGENTRGCRSRIIRQLWLETQRCH